MRKYGARLRPDFIKSKSGFKVTDLFTNNKPTIIMKMIYSGIVAILLLTACEGQNKENRNQGQSDPVVFGSDANEGSSGVFSTTHEDLEEDTNELKKEISELREELNGSDTTARQTFEQQLSYLDQGVEKLEGKVLEFRSATDERKEAIEEEFEMEEENLEERIKEVKDLIED